MDAAVKVTPDTIRAMKTARQRIAALTAYDYPMARLLDEAGIPVILVGDSLGMVVLGYENTLPVTMEEMLHHSRAVSRGAKTALLIGDMPFMSDSAGPVPHPSPGMAQPTIDVPPFKVSSYAAPLVPARSANYEDTESPTVTTTLKP